MRRLEREEEYDTDRAAAMLGYEVVRFSQPRATKQTPGIPDRLYLHPVRRLAIWAEIKAEGGKRSNHQVRMHELLAASGHEVVTGPAAVVAPYLADRLRESIQEAR